jgi:hypothetical protein
MTEKPYLIKCKKCNVEFYSSTTYAKFCPECKKISIGMKFYPKLYYKNRQIAFDRDEYKCQCCGCENGKLKTNTHVVHHIDGDTFNNSLSNLITLCTQCHASLHKKYSKYILRRSNIYKLFAQEKQFGEFGKTMIYEPAKKMVKKQFTGKPKLFFGTK